MDLMSTRNRLMPNMEDLGPQRAGLPLTLSLRILQQSTHREKLSMAAVTIRIHYSKMVTMLRADTPDMGDATQRRRRNFSGGSASWSLAVSAPD